MKRLSFRPGRALQGFPQPADPGFRAALACRSAALFVILWQLRLLAGDLADTAVFAASLLCAFGAGFFLSARPLPAALASIALIPWAARLFLGLPRLLARSPGAIGSWDSLLLNLDRNNFVSLPPFYWAALTTYFSARSRRFLRADTAAACALITAIFLVSPSADQEAYRLPVLPVAIFSCVVFLLLLAWVFSLPPELKVRKRERLLSTAVILLFVLAGGLLVLRSSQEQAADRGGGLLRPNLFQFDFSQILRLESEITMTGDLAFIVRREGGEGHNYMRRYVLSGNDQKQGFYRIPEIDDPVHPPVLPSRRTALDAEVPEPSRIAEQEYYLVNLDSAAFVGMNQPVEILPFENYDASSFVSAYAVKSLVSAAGPLRLMANSPESSATAGPRFDPESLGMGAEEFARYTAYSASPRIRAMAQELTQGLSSYWEITQTLYEWLRYGDYRYSMKPGIAVDGDQLSHFLFVSKKGYCSYFAFAFAVMLRSLGIPCRVAVGFYLDPELKVFDYYPVRSDMAHAWVEVYYPGAGWVDYDPTTTLLAAGEDFDFSRGVPQDMLERLMREILENRPRLRVREGGDDASPGLSPEALGGGAARLLRRAGPLLAFLLIAVIFILIRCGPLLAFFALRSPRKKTLALWRQSRRRLSLGGIRRGRGEGEGEWALRVDGVFRLGLYALYQDASEARYAAVYGAGAAVWEHYRAFSRRCRGIISPARRILAWLCPPLALRRRKGPGA
ncbi:MAG: transglutaminase-like domain-containing protein [Spirochaetaceae bacterium]|nr:transglutaminase-like domain-containing protein [Spirochaetaceae bacterium]